MQEYINSSDINPKLNREQRRAIAKKTKQKNNKQIDIISEYARKLSYVNLIQKLRKINTEKEKEKELNNEQTT